jgi:hypothetical protein
MKTRSLTIPEIGMIAGTRMALGAGAAFLFGERLDRDARKGAGWALLMVGVLTTIPLVANLLGKGSGGREGYSD